MKLFGFELLWASAALGAVLPERTALPHGIERMNPGRFLAETVNLAPFEQSIGLRFTVWMVALAPLWVLRRPRTIAGLPPPERERVLERLLASRVYAVRQLTIALKALASMLYARSPEARAAMTSPARRSAAEPAVLARRLPRALPIFHGDPHEHAAE